MKQQKDMDLISIIDTKKDELLVPVEERLSVEALEVVIINFSSDGVDDYDEILRALDGRGLYIYAQNKLNLDLENRQTSLARSSIEEPLILELKGLPSHLFYAFLGANSTLIVIFTVDLLKWHTKALVSIK